MTEINNIDQQIKEIEADLKVFEQQYQLSSEQFYQQFEERILGNDVNFVE